MRCPLATLISVQCVLCPSRISFLGHPTTAPMCFVLIVSRNGQRWESSDLKIICNHMQLKPKHSCSCRCWAWHQLTAWLCDLHLGTHLEIRSWDWFCCDQFLNLFPGTWNPEFICLFTFIDRQLFCPPTFFNLRRYTLNMTIHTDVVHKMYISALFFTNCLA